MKHLVCLFMLSALAACGGPMDTPDGGDSGSQQGGQALGCAEYTAARTGQTTTIDPEAGTLYHACGDLGDCAPLGETQCEFTHPNPWPDMDGGASPRVCTRGCNPDGTCPNGGICITEGTSTRFCLSACGPNDSCPPLLECVSYNGQHVCAATVCR